VAAALSYPENCVEFTPTIEAAGVANAYTDIPFPWLTLPTNELDEAL
jgi:hypothetical protein